MFRRHSPRRSTNIVFVIFRLILSLVMFAVLLAGVYSAYKYFSGFDPLNLSPQALVSSLIKSKSPQQFLASLTAVVNKQVLPASKQILGQKTDIGKPSGAVLFSFLLVADSHNDNTNLQKAINQAKQMHPDLSFIIGLGDYTDVGTLDELKSAKKQFDSSGLRYFLVPGDHDLWDARNRSLPATANFREVFGPNYQSFNFSQFKFLLLDNSDDYQGLGEDQIKWITTELEKAKNDQAKGITVFLHEPLFHPSSDHVMGKVEKDLKQQARNLIFQFKGAGVKKIFAGDIHYFSEYEDGETKLPMVTVGAVTGDRNPQSPRFAIGYVFEDGTVKVEDVEIRP